MSKLMVRDKRRRSKRKRRKRRKRKSRRKKRRRRRKRKSRRKRMLPNKMINLLIKCLKRPQKNPMKDLKSAISRVQGSKYTRKASVA